MKKFIRENLFKSNGAYNSNKTEKWFLKHNPNELSKIKDLTNFLPDDVSMSVRCQYILEDKKEPKSCLTCGIELDLYKPIIGPHAREFCSNSCGQKNSITREKVKKTTLKNHGFECALADNSFFKKKYGVDNPSQLEFVQKKKKKNAIKKYGVYYQQKHLSQDAVHKLSDIEYLAKTPKHQIYEETGISQSHLSKIFQRHNLNSSKSQIEDEIYDFLQQYNTVILRNKRTILDNEYELDFYLPEYNLGIEYHGLYWHSEIRGLPKDYHYKKYLKAKERDIHLLQIFENEWYDKNKRDVWKSIIGNKLNASNKIYARKTNIVKLKNKDFFNNNHLQGNAGSSISYGLEYNNEIVFAMSFRKPRFNYNYDFELIRAASKLNHAIVGGASKIMSYFRKQHTGSIISYADLRYASGKVYENIGFRQIGTTSPNFWYIEDWKTLHNRMSFQKHKLKDKLEFFDPNLSEWENMKLNGYNRIWDCGNQIWSF